MTAPETDTQYAGLNAVERAAAMAEPHMRECDAPSIEKCPDCRGRLRVIRRVLEAAVPVVQAEERTRIQELLTIPVLKAVRAIPDGRIQTGCVIQDGATVRERLRQAYLAIDGEGVVEGDPREPERETP